MVLLTRRGKGIASRLPTFAADPLIAVGDVAQPRLTGRRHRLVVSRLPGRLPHFQRRYEQSPWQAFGAEEGW